MMEARVCPADGIKCVMDECRDKCSLSGKLCEPGRHRGPFTFGQVAGWMTCKCGTDIQTRFVEANRSRL